MQINKPAAHRRGGSGLGSGNIAGHTANTEEDVVSGVRSINARTRRDRADATEAKKEAAARAKITLPTLRFQQKKAGD